MEQSISKIQSTIMRDYYKDFSKYSRGRKPEKLVAWVTSFAPIEILEALDISYYYPESYAAVIAASGRDQEMLQEGDNNALSTDCCSYSCCIEGCLVKEDGPRGIPPKPDILIATNNQCNTLPNWDLDGYAAVLLWDWHRKGMKGALETLTAYNILDTVDLEKLMCLAYNLKTAELGGGDDMMLPEPEAVSVPYEPDRTVIRKALAITQRERFY